MPRVGAVVLGALRVAAPRRGLGRLRQMHRRPSALQLLDDEPPARRRLQRDLELAPREALKEPSHAGTVGRRHARTADLAAVGVQPVRRDLRSMLIESHHDRHSGASSRSMA
jgi:hypothetical protein